MSTQAAALRMDPSRGWWQVHSERQVRDILRPLSHGAKINVERDTLIGGPGDGTPLVAEAGDFWFHTDGAFLPLPPRWVFILVLEAETGGALQLLDSNPWLSRVSPTAVFWFGRAGSGVTAAACSRVDGIPLFRYRHDYMEQLPGEISPEVIHGIVREEAEKAITVGELRPRTGLLLDNWRFLHRRTAFTGRRLIRRVWLSVA